MHGTPRQRWQHAQQTWHACVQSNEGGPRAEHAPAVEAAAAAAHAHACTAARMPPLARHQLLPMQPQHLLLRRAQALLGSQAGDVNHAYGLLRAALRHADARGEAAVRAACFLHLARIEALAGEPHKALVLAQGALQATKDSAVWLQAVLLYSQQRCVQRPQSPQRPQSAAADI